MPQLPPALVSGDVLTYGAYNQANTGNQHASSSTPRGQRFLVYGGAWYCLFFYWGPEPLLRLRVNKSTDAGATWSVMDEADEPQPNASSSANFNSSFVQGTKIWLFLDHELTSGTPRTYQIRGYSFDCATEQWAAGYLSGKSDTNAGGETGYLLKDACLRGSDEIIVAYHYPLNTGGGVSVGYVDIYNTTSSTWTTTDKEIFDGAGAFEQREIDACMWDGTYMHFWSDIHTGPYTRTKLHRTMDSGNALGTEQNILAAVDPTWVDPNVAYLGPYWQEYGESYQYPIYSIMHSGKIYAFQTANISAFTDDGISGTYWWLNRREVIAWVCNADEAVPTWGSEAVKKDIVNIAFYPSPFVSGGQLHCFFNIDNIDYDDEGALAYATRGVSSWGTSGEFYNWTTNPPAPPDHLPGTSGLRVTYIVPAPDIITGVGFGAIATLNYWYTESVWFLSLGGCCCADFAY